jgi:dystonin
MGAVADLFDRNGEGLIDWQEFIAALRPDWQDRKPANDTDKIHDEVKRLVMLCTCRQKFRVFQVGEGKYRVSKKRRVRYSISAYFVIPLSDHSLAIRKSYAWSVF